MSEYTTEIQQPNTEQNPREEVIIRQLSVMTGEDITNPSIFGLTTEQANEVYQRFKCRTGAEIDLPVVTDGVIPVDALFNPDINMHTIETGAAPAEVKVRSRFYRAAINTFLRQWTGSEATAYFNLHDRVISVFPKLDAFSTVVAIAKGNFDQVIGPALGHEAIHAHQAGQQSYGYNFQEFPAMLQEMQRLRQTNPELSRREAATMVQSSPDLRILTEAQAYLFQYSITGGAGREAVPDEIVKAKANVAKLRSGEITVEGLTPALREVAAKALEEMEYASIPLARYSKNGYAPTLELVTNQTKRYLTGPEQANQDLLRRVRSAIIQMVRLLDKGASHSEIADLIRKNYYPSSEAEAWDSYSQQYKFLQNAIEKHPNQKVIDEETLLTGFDRQIEKRVIKLRRIATEELINQANATSRSSH